MAIQIVRNEAPQWIGAALAKGISSGLGDREGRWEVDITAELAGERVGYRNLRSRQFSLGAPVLRRRSRRGCHFRSSSRRCFGSSGLEAGTDASLKYVSNGRTVHREMRFLDVVPEVFSILRLLPE